LIKKIFFIISLTIFLFASNLNKFGFDDFKVETNCDKILIYPNQYRCYDYKLKEPRIVLYKIDKNVNIGNYKKRLSFRYDKKIMKQYKNNLKCYVKSGYDRGHMANDADFDYNLTILKTTYLTSNIVPMSPKLNRYVLKKYENYERKLASKYNVVVLMGIIPSKIRLKNKEECAIIPLYVYKAFFVKVKDGYKFIFAVILDQKGNEKKIPSYDDFKKYLNEKNINLYFKYVVDVAIKIFW
jgi:endonuclease G